MVKIKLPFKKTFPETYSDLTDFKFLQEYIREYTKTTGRQERIYILISLNIYSSKHVSINNFP